MTAGMATKPTGDDVNNEPVLYSGDAASVLILCFLKSIFYRITDLMDFTNY